MRIVLLNDDSLPSARGGAAVVVDRLRRGLHDRGHDVTLVTTHQDKNRPQKELRIDDAGTTWSLLTQVPPNLRHYRCLRNRETIPPLLSLLRDLRPDVVHAHNLHQYLSYAALDAAREVTDRVFLTAHDTFLVSFHRVSGERFFRENRAGRPYRMSVWEHLRDAGKRYNPLRNARIRSCLRRTGTTVVSISDTLDGFLRCNGIGNTRVIHNGVPIQQPPPTDIVERFRARHRLRGPTILFGGRVSRDKGIGALLATFERVLERAPEAQLLIVGDAEATEAAVADASERIRGAIRAAGWMDQADMPIAYAAADVVTTPSLYLDAFNLMNAEAMAAGKPVVGTCFGGTPEIVEDGATGFVVDPRDTAVFADRLTALLMDPALRSRMGAAARRRAEKEFSLEQCLDAHEQLYAEDTRRPPATASPRRR